MKLATTTGDFERYTDNYLDRVKLVQEAGFKHIDLSLYTVAPNDSLLVLDNWRKCAEELKEYADQNGLDFVQAHLPNVNPMAGEAEFEDAVKKAIRSIEICGALEIPCGVIHPGWDRNATKEEWYEVNGRFFEKLFPVMEKNNVCVLHENTTKVNMPWFFPKTGADMREFSDYINHPLFHSCWDTGHANIEGSQYDEIMTIGDDLYAVHINDNRGSLDEHVIPYFGTLNMDEIMHALIDVNFKGTFTLEASSSIRSSKYWLGHRHVFEKDTRLADAPLELQLQLEKFMYSVGKHILSAYGQFED